MLSLPRSLALPALALGLLTSGCDANESLLGEFIADRTVNGATEAIDGEAIYTIVDSSEGPRFVLVLFEGDLGDNGRDDYSFISFTREADRPGVGAYSVDEDTDAPSVVAVTIANVTDGDDPLEAEGYVLRGRTGLLSITGADDYGNLAGSFNVEADGASVRVPVAEVDGRASGRFEAYYERPSVLRSFGVDLGR